MKISKEALTILDSCRVDGQAVFLPPGQLDRKLYESVNKVLELIGGKWNRKARAHLFQDDPEGRLDMAVITGDVVDLRKEFQFFETPPAIAAKMVELARITHTSEVLEPSAGRGAIVRAILEHHEEQSITVVELQRDNISHLITLIGRLGWCTVQQGDFLELYRAGERIFDRVVMNPPFTKQQDIEHVTRAFSVLNPGGLLVSIMGAGAVTRDTAKGQAFRKLLMDFGEYEPMPPDSFKASGTSCNTVMVQLRNPL